MKLHPASRWHALYVFTHLGATRMFTGCFSFTSSTKILSWQRHGREPSSLTFCLLPHWEASEGLFLLLLGGTLLQTPVVWLPPKKWENNKIGKGKMKEIKREKKLTTENKATFWEKRWGWRGLKKQKEDEWKPHAKQEDLENICTYITK